MYGLDNDGPETTNRNNKQYLVSRRVRWSRNNMQYLVSRRVKE